MKIHILASLTLIPCLAFAQSTNEAPQTTPPPAQASDEPKHEHHRMDPDKQLEFLTAKLSLSTIQQSEIKPVLVSRDEKMKSIHEDTSLSKEQKHSDIKDLMESTNQQIESYLNPEQVPLFKEMHKHHEKKPAQQ